MELTASAAPLSCKRDALPTKTSPSPRKHPNAKITSTHQEHPAMLPAHYAPAQQCPGQTHRTASPVRHPHTATPKRSGHAAKTLCTSPRAAWAKAPTVCGYSRRSRLAMAPCACPACPAAAGGGTSGVLAACKARSKDCQQQPASLLRFENNRYSLSTRGKVRLAAWFALSSCDRLHQPSANASVRRNACTLRKSNSHKSPAESSPAKPQGVPGRPRR